MEYLVDILFAFWATLAEMAPWLIGGFLVAGVLSVFVPTTLVQRHLGGRGVWPVFKAAVLGVPIPVCSCGVIPLGAGLFRQGASRGATSSFMLSTPQTGVDSIAATYALMGPVFAVVRPVVALVNGVFGGLLIDAMDKRGRGERGTRSAKPQAAAERETSSSCCGTATAAPAACCGAVEDAAGVEALRGKVGRALRYGLVTLPADIAGALIVGVLVAALLTALVPNDALAPYLGGGFLAMCAAVLVGAPLYICATASIPVALGLMAAGASPGAVLAFLIAGPATNAATISVTWTLLGRRTGVLYLLSVVVTAVGAGLLLDAMFTLESLRLPEGILHAHEHGLSWIDHLAAVAMLAVLLPAVGKRLVGWGSRSDQAEEDCCAQPRVPRVGRRLGGGRPVRCSGFRH